MNILVTGGAGFIGSSLIKKILSNNFSENLNVYSLDNYFTGSKKNHIEGIKYVEGSCRDVANIFSKINFDVIFHLGEYSRVESSFNEVEVAISNILDSSPALIDYASKTNALLIYSASSSKFGNNNENLSPYAWMKSKMVELIKNYSDWFGLNYHIVYYYNVYGEGQIESGKYATAIGIFKTQFLNNQSITVVSPGTQKRDFTHIDDIIEGLIRIFRFGKKNMEWHLRRNKPISILDVAKKFSDDIVMLPERKGNREEAINSDCSLEDRLNWRPRKNLEDYIDEIRKSKYN